METRAPWTEEETKKVVRAALRALKRGLPSVGLASEFLMDLPGYEAECKRLSDLFIALCKVEADLKARGVTR